MNYETCWKKLEALASYYAEHGGQQNEATTPLHLIDRLFFECLVRDRDNCVTKEGSYFELPAGESRSEYKSRYCTVFTRLSKGLLGKC